MLTVGVVSSNECTMVNSCTLYDNATKDALDLHTLSRCSYTRYQDVLVQQAERNNGQIDIYCHAEQIT